MRGHVPTPAGVVDDMIAELFARRPPTASDTLVDPGCGDGPFILGVLRYCDDHGFDPPRIVGIEMDPNLAAEAREAVGTGAGIEVEVWTGDFLMDELPEADFIVGNPPYVAITGLDEHEKERYRNRFRCAQGRFDLYGLFFERALGLLRDDGRLVFITPEKFEYVGSAENLRRLLARFKTQHLRHLAEDTFPGRVAYPVITTVDKVPAPNNHRTMVTLRSGSESWVVLPRDGSSWNAAIHADEDSIESRWTLDDVALRVSCGVATGADKMFVQREDELPKPLRDFARPTISGRQLGRPDYTDEMEVARTSDVMLIPYDDHGELLKEEDLGSLGEYLQSGRRKEKLRDRTCAQGAGRPWYQFHDNVPLPDLLRPKILCKDIASEPRFWVDRSGDIVPRHSVYYIVPHHSIDLDRLAAFLNSDPVRDWLEGRCHRAANGFYRLQSTVLKKLPVPIDDVKASGDPRPDSVEGRRALSYQATL